MVVLYFSYGVDAIELLDSWREYIVFADWKGCLKLKDLVKQKQDKRIMQAIAIAL